uniref:Cytochrome P450 314A1 n=1 Tax=Pardosa pseudoannulata TaxID=330961 RepID=A0A6H0C3U9_9ARAC|nr:cytochrome P450 314A1 [Pardosa pseudoannulata]
MVQRRGVYGPLSRLLFHQTQGRQTTFGNNVSTQKTDGSATLLSPNTASNTYYEFKDIPGPRPSVPFIGTAWQYFPGGRYSLSNVFEASNDKFRRYGSVSKEEFQWRKPVVHLFSPSDFEMVAASQGDKPIRPISDFLKHYRQNRPEKYDSVGLANSLGDEWARLRKILMPVFNRLNGMESFKDDINNICDDFVELIRRERDGATCVVNNLQDYLYRLALEGVYMLCLEARLGCLQGNLKPDSPASTMIHSVKLLFEAFQELYYGLPVWKFYPTSAYKKLDKAESIMYEATSNRIQEVMEELRKRKSKPIDERGVLETLLHMDCITDKTTKVTIIDFISGGIFTVTNAFCFLLCHMAKHPEVQETLYQKLREVIPEGSRIGSDIGNTVPFLRHCIKESFRLTPTIPTITRILNTDIVASGYHIPSGVPLFCNFTVPCKQSQFFSDPERFRPDRWYTCPRQPFLMLPFGFGSRMCVGRRFAETEMHTALAKLILNFKLESTGEEVKCKQAFIIVPSHPVSIVFKERNKC